MRWVYGAKVTCFALGDLPVCWNRLVVFIENSDPKATKQDCELKAFARLAPRLKKDFPQLLLCLCMDGLFESLRNRLIPPEATDPAIAIRIQIRLDTS